MRRRSAIGRTAGKRHQLQLLLLPLLLLLLLLLLVLMLLLLLAGSLENVFGQAQRGLHGNHRRNVGQEDCHTGG